MRGRIKSTAAFARTRPGSTSDGYGFLTGSDGVDRFFHCDQLFGVKLADLRVGDWVTFVPSEGARGPRASNVWPVMHDV